jgi:tetratricopeptide (TPR) repeat protein
MITQATKADVQIVRNNPHDPVFGGYEDIKTLKNNLKNTSEKILFEELIHKRAVEQNRKFEEKSARALIEIGDIHYKKGAFARASSAYIKALKLDEDNIPTFQKLIQTLLISNRLSEADRFYSNFLKKVNDHPRYVNDYLAFRITISLINEDLAQDSKVIFKKLENSENDAILNSIGLFYSLIEQDSEKAIGFYKKSLEINPDNIDANNNLGAMLRNKNQFDVAERYLQKAHFLDLKYSSAYENLAGLYFMQNNLHKAISILENAKANFAEVSNLWKHNLAIFYYQNSDYDKAIKNYKELHTKEPDNSLILNNIGAAYEKLSKVSLAEKYFSGAIELVRDNTKNKKTLDQRAVMAFINYARTLVNHDQSDQALKILKDAHKFFPLDYTVYHFESTILGRSGDFSKAKEKLLISLDLNPHYLDSIADLSYILVDIDFDFQSAIDLIEPINLNGDHQLIKILSNNLAYAYIKTDQLQKAKKLLREDDKTFTAYATKGYYLLKSGDLKKAKAMYDKAIGLTTGLNQNRVYQFYYFELMEYWRNQSDYKKAISYAKKCIKYNVNKKIHQTASAFISSQS